jgi:phage terminase small subunit
MPQLRNSKHEAVLQAFLRDPKRVGWRAYKAVYRKSSQRAAETAWSRLLKDAVFKARHDELLKAVTQAAVDAAVMDLQEVLAELSKLGRANMQDFVVGGDDTADVIESLQALPREHAAAIQELTIDTYMEGKGDDAREVKRVKLKLHDKKGSLAELRRHLEPVKHEHSGTLTLEMLVAASMEKKAAPAKKAKAA